MEQKELIVSHKIYLTKEQRYHLRNPGIFIDAVGLKLSVWKKGVKTNEPQEDKSEHYRITNVYGKPVYTYSDGITYINLPNNESVTGLLDPKDGGFKFFRFMFKEVYSENNEIKISIHYIIIADLDEYNLSKI